MNGKIHKKDHFNPYEFHRPGMKTTDEFGDLLKEIDREEFDEPYLVCRFLGLCGKRIYRCYKNALSNFMEEEVQQKLHENDTVNPGLMDKQTSTSKSYANTEKGSLSHQPKQHL